MVNYSICRIVGTDENVDVDTSYANMDVLSDDVLVSIFQIVVPYEATLAEMLYRCGEHFSFR